MPASALFGLGFASGVPSSPTSSEAVGTDATGDVFVAGGFSGTVSFGGISLTSKGAENAYVAKLNPSGTVAWAARMGGSSPSVGDYARGVALDGQGNVYVTGFFSGNGDFGPFNLTGNGDRDVFVEKLDPMGNVLWAKNFGGSGPDLGQAIAVDGAGNVYLTGSYQNSMTVGATTLTAQGGNDAFVLKLDTLGNPVWAKSVGGSASDSGFSIALDSANNVYTTGIFSSTAQFGTTTLTARGGAGDTDSFVMKMDANGNVAWVDQFGGTGHDDGTGVSVGSTGNIYATGDFSGSATFGGSTLTSTGGGDAYLVRLDASGNVVWARGFGGSALDAGLGVTTDGSGNVVDVGFFQNTMTLGGVTLSSGGGTDAYLARFDPNGNVLSAQSFGSSQNDSAYQASVSPKNGNVSVAGDYGGAMSVGGVPLPAGGNGYVVQFGQTVAASPAPSDYLNLGATQPAVFRPSRAQWFALGPGGGQALGSFGAPRLYDIPVPGDFDGTGHTELAVFRPATSEWFALNPATGGHLVAQFGAPNLYDIPVPSDYDGVGHTEPAVFRPATSEWFVLNPVTGGHFVAQFGAPNLYDLPVPGDYDGTGRVQPAVFRPSTGQWFVLRPNGGALLVTFGRTGLADVPVPGDWDHVGYTEPAVFDPLTTRITVLGPTGPHFLATFGAPNFYDIPTQAPAGALVRLSRIQAQGIHTRGVSSESGPLFVTPAGPVQGAPAPGSPVGSSSSGRTDSGTGSPFLRRALAQGNRGPTVTQGFSPTRRPRLKIVPADTDRLDPPLGAS